LLTKKHCYCEPKGAGAGAGAVVLLTAHISSLV
jgi:hypothetical protein